MNTFMECSFPQDSQLEYLAINENVYHTDVLVVHKICHTELLGTVAFCFPTKPMYPESGDDSDMEE